MTICPKCGKEYRVTPDVCEECGTVLSDADFSDPFAEAVRDEAALREQSRLRREARLNPPAPAETEQAPAAEGFDDADEPEPAGEKHSGLRALAVTAALAVAAGGGWYGWKRFGKGKVNEPKPAGTDIRYCIGNQAYFYNGITGLTAALGEPSGLSQEEWATFWDHTTVSDDHSRIFYPQRPYSEDYNAEVFYPYYIDLNSQDAVPQAVMPLIYTKPNAYNELNCNIWSYDLLDEAGDSMLLQCGSMVNNRITDLISDSYAVWQDPAKHDGSSLAMNQTVFRSAYPVGNQSGAFLVVTETEMDSGIARINDNTDGRRYALQLYESNGDSYVTVSSSLTGWKSANPSDDGFTEGKPRYLFYTASHITNQPDLPDASYMLSRNGLTIEVIRGQYFAGNEASLALSPEDLQRAGHEMRQSSLFEYGTELHRYDLKTGTDTVLYNDLPEITTMENIAVLPNGAAFVVDYAATDDPLYPGDPENEAQGYIRVYSVLGGDTPPVLPYPMNQIQFMMPADVAGNRFVFGSSDGEIYILDCTLDGGTIFPVTFDVLGGHDFVVRAQTNSTGTGLLLVTTGNLPDDESQYLIDLTAISRQTDSALADSITARKISDDRNLNRYVGSHLITYAPSDPEDSRFYTMKIDDHPVASLVDSEAVFSDPTTDAVIFLTLAEGNDRNSSYRTLNCWLNGKVTQIADHVVADSVTVDSLTGGIVFVRYDMTALARSDSSAAPYSICVGTAAAESFEDCITVSVSRELPVLFSNPDDTLSD